MTFRGIMGRIAACARHDARRAVRAAHGHGMTTVWEITPERAAALPQWSIESPEPPVSIGDVARIAEAWLKARSPDVRQFALQNVTIARIGRSSNPAIDFWHYQVLFLGAGARPGDLLFRVVVLPDQTVVEPRTEPDR